MGRRVRGAGQAHADHGLRPVPSGQV